MSCKILFALLLVMLVTSCATVSQKDIHIYDVKTDPLVFEYQVEVLQNKERQGGLFGAFASFSNIRAGDIYQHGWSPLYQIEQEDENYGLYTYVLFGYPIEKLNKSDPEEFKNIKTKYQNILKVISSHYLVPDTERVTRAAAVMKNDEETMNVFFVPFLEDKPVATNNYMLRVGEYNKLRKIRYRTASISEYNSLLSTKLIKIISASLVRSDKDLAYRISNEPGPFLISTKKPISYEVSNKDRSNMLLLDLTNTHNEAISEVIRSYKRWLLDLEIKKGVKEFESLRLAILNYLLKFDENLPLIKSVIAEWVPDQKQGQ